MTGTFTIGELKDAIEKSGLNDTASVMCLSNRGNIHAVVSIQKRKVPNEAFSLILHTVKVKP